MVSSTNHKEQMVASKGNSSLNKKKKKKQSCTKWSFLVENPVLVVGMVLLDRLVA